MSSLSIGSAVALAVLALLCGPGEALAISVDFTLLEDSSFAGAKPQAPMPSTGDWLVGTADDAALPAIYNPQGSLSHNMADLTGVGGSGFNQAPSLSGGLTMEFSSSGAGNWDVSVAAMAYAGVASPVMVLDQHLVTPGSPAASNPTFNVDGLTNSGTWQEDAAANWALDYDLDFYLATNLDGDPSATDVDATFNDTEQVGFLIPVGELTPAGLGAVTLDDPAGFFAGDFEDYLLNTLAPLLPGDATYLLLTQMAKVNPVYAELGLPITGSTLMGNTTIAYTTDEIAAVPGDFDGDGDVDADDVDVLCANMGGDPGAYDIDGDGIVDEDDMIFHVENHLEYDTDGNGTADGQGTFRGDFNTDGTVNGTDLSILAGEFGNATSTAIPEPACMLLLSLGGVVLVRHRKA